MAQCFEEEEGAVGEEVFFFCLFFEELGGVGVILSGRSR